MLSHLECSSVCFRYRREKARASDLQAQVNAMNNRSRFDVQMIHEQQKQIQKLQEVCFSTHSNQ